MTLEDWNGCRDIQCEPLQNAKCKLQSSKDNFLRTLVHHPSLEVFRVAISFSR